MCDECKQGKIRDTLARAMKALRRSHLKCAKNFLKIGTSVNTNTLITAAEQGDLVSVNKYVKAGIDMNHMNKYGFTPLIAASSRGRSKCAIALLEAGSSVNLSPKNGKTALYHASWNGFNPCVEILMNAGADVNMRTNDNRTPLFGAAMGRVHRDSEVTRRSRSRCECSRRTSEFPVTRSKSQQAAVCETTTSIRSQN